jgi:hypothetical protein
MRDEDNRLPISQELLGHTSNFEFDFASSTYVLTSHDVTQIERYKPNRVMDIITIVLCSGTSYHKNEVELSHSTIDRA